MARYPVLKKFRDRDTREIFEIGSAYETEDKERVKKLQGGGWVGKEIKGTKSKLESERLEVDNP